MRRTGRWLAVAALLAAACGGGGGGGPSTPPPPSQSLVFTAAGTPGTNTIYLEASGASTPERLILEVRANEVEDLFGVSFDLVYPQALLDWDEAAVTEGDLLPRGRTNTSLIIDQRPAGRLLVGYTRLGDDTPGVSGSGILLTLEFPTTTSGSGDFVFEREFAVDGSGIRRFDFTWLAGSLRVVR